MPYVAERLRDLLKEGRMPSTPGELNYLITLLCIEYVDEHDRKYEICNAVVGALECAKLEFYRRVVAPYEQKKITENGDVFPEAMTRG